MLSCLLGPLSCFGVLGDPAIRSGPGFEAYRKYRAVGYWPGYEGCVGKRATSLCQ